MKRVLIFLLSTILVCAPLAQGGAGSRFRQTSILNAGASLLYMPAVQKELGLNATVTKKIQDKLADATREAAFSFSSVSRTNAKAVQAELEKRAKAMEKVQNECLAMLTPAQKNRLRQITIQQAGASVMFNPEIKKELSLNDTQAKKIGEIVQASYRIRSTSANSQPNHPAKPEDRMKQMQEMFKRQEAAKAKAEADASKVLTPAQQAKWKAMKGKPFKLDKTKLLRGATTVGSRRFSA